MISNIDVDDISFVKANLLKEIKDSNIPNISDDVRSSIIKYSLDETNGYKNYVDFVSIIYDILCSKVINSEITSDFAVELFKQYYSVLEFDSIIEFLDISFLTDVYLRKADKKSIYAGVVDTINYLDSCKVKKFKNGMYMFLLRILIQNKCYADYSDYIVKLINYINLLSDDDKYAALIPYCNCLDKLLMY